MVKKVKRFVVFMLFSFLYTLLSGKTAEAKPTLCIFPKGENGKLFYHGNPTNVPINDSWCGSSTPTVIIDDPGIIGDPGTTAPDDPSNPQDPTDPEIGKTEYPLDTGSEVPSIPDLPGEPGINDPIGNPFGY